MQPTKKRNSKIECPKKETVSYEITKTKTQILWTKPYNFGIGKLTFKKVLEYNIKLSEADKNSFRTVGIGNNNFNIGFSFGIEQLVDIATKTGFSVGLGDWGAVKLAIKTTIGNISLGLAARVETLKFWEDSTLTASLTSKVYDKDKVKISVIDSAEFSINALVLAVIAIVTAKVIVHLIGSGGAIAAGFRAFLETFPAMLKGAEVVSSLVG